MFEVDVMTITSHDVIMKVGIAELKARLSEYLREVRRGRTVTVVDRETPVARIIPYTSGVLALNVRRPSARSPGLHRIPLPPPLRIDTEIVALLLEERQGER
jgi:prevent-host-death family protein